MLNYFYWYSIITTLILVLYNIPLSRLNTKLDITFFSLILLSILISLFLGIINKKRFKYKDYIFNEKNKKHIIPIIFILCSSIFEFSYFKEIPFIKSTIMNVSSYRDFEGIPIFHVLICMLAMYYSVKYFYIGVSDKKNRFFNIFCCILINIVMILYNMRSFLLINVFIILNIIYSKIKITKKIKIKTKLFLIFLLIIILYFFGSFGNMREIHEANNNSYIETLGEYYSWPKYIPKQYMWTYSYITSPLANLNYNIKNNNKLNITGYIYSYLPDSISKRMPNYINKNICILKRTYFNVSTGYCGTLVNSNLLGLIIFWIIIMIFPFTIFRFQNTKENQYLIFILLYGAAITYMFFTNMFNYGGTAPAIWFSFFILITKKRR